MMFRMPLFFWSQAAGILLRGWFRVRTIDEALAVMRSVYRLLGIDFHGAPDCFVMTRCSLSVTHSPRACRLMSSFDRGLLSGLTRGKTMVFTQRITEGAPFCKGVIA